MQEPRYAQAAREALDFILFRLRDEEGRLLHAWRQGIGKQPGFLDDYSYLINACLDLYEVECDESLVETARNLTDGMLHLFSDPAGGALFYTANNQTPLVARLKDQHDSSVPSGNSAAACGLLRLARLTGLGKYRQRAEEIIRSALTVLDRAPLAVGQLLVAGWNLLHQEDFLVFVCPDRSSRSAALQLEQRYWLPQATCVVRSASEDGRQSPLLDQHFYGRDVIGGQVTLYHCRGTTCLPPVVGWESITQKLAELGGTPAANVSFDTSR